MEARKTADALAEFLRGSGWEVLEAIDVSANLEGGFVVEASREDGFRINVEVVGGPWEDDGTYDADDWYAGWHTG